jgi:carboxylesterase
MDGILVLHGLTGSPQSVSCLADAFAGAGWDVELPLLPGHGTSIDDLLRTAWADWSVAAETAFDRLAARCDRVAVAGLSMGGALALWLAVRHPEIAGLVLVNPAVATDPAERSALQELLDGGLATLDGIAGDLADPDAHEDGYDQLAIGPTLSLFDALDALDLAVEQPVLLFTSRQDHVVNPASSQLLVDRARNGVDHVFLERSFHVATLDHDHVLIEQRAVAFLRTLWR